MTTVLVGVQDGRGQKIPNAAVTIKDRFTGITVSQGVAGQQGEASLTWTGTPLGTYRATAVTPGGITGTADFELDWIAASRTVVVNVPQSSEGTATATFLAEISAAWNTVAWFAVPVIVIGVAYLAITRGPDLIAGARKEAVVVKQKVMGR